MLRSYPTFRRLLCSRVHSLANFNDITPSDDSLEQFNNLELQELELNPGLANEHIRELLKHRSSFHQALNLFQGLNERSVLVPELGTCIEIIRGFCTRGEIDPAIHLLRRMSSEKSFERSRPNTPAFNLILGALSKSGDRVVELREIFLEMSKEVRDESSYSFYILGLYRAGRTDAAMVVKREMLERWKPSRFIYSALISGLCKSGQLDQALKQLQEMIKLGVEPDVACFTSIIDALERKGKFLEAIEVFQRMLSSGCKPDRILSTRLLDCFIDRGELAQGSSFIQELLENELSSPVMSSINLLVRRLCIAGKLDEGIELVRKMNEKGCNPSLLIYCDLIAALCEKKRAKDAAEVYFDGKLLGHLLDDHLNPGVFQKLWGVKQEEGKFREMMSRSSPGDVCAYNFQLARLESHGEKLELLRGMIERGIVPDYQSYEIVIRGLCRAGKGLEGYGVFEQLVGSSRVPSKGICCRVVDALLESEPQDSELVKGAFRQMIDDGYVPDDRLCRVIAFIRQET